MARVLAWSGNPAWRFKIGMGKPFGMGAVRIDSRLHLYDRKNRYDNLFQNDSGWDSGEFSADEADRIQQEAIDVFEKTILSSPELNPRSVTEFSRLERIRDLLKLLSWPGSDSSLTRYMEIERGGHNIRYVSL